MILHRFHLADFLTLLWGLGQTGETSRSQSISGEAHSAALCFTLRCLLPPPDVIMLPTPSNYKEPCGMCSSEQTKKTSTRMRVSWPNSSQEWCPLADETPTSTRGRIYSILQWKGNTIKITGTLWKSCVLLRISDCKLGVNFWGSGERLLLCSLGHIWSIRTSRVWPCLGSSCIGSPLQGHEG